MEPIFEKVASQVSEDRTMGESSAVLGKVDATAEKYLSGSSFAIIQFDSDFSVLLTCNPPADRFAISSFPTFHMFSKGRMYDYKG